jgi:hypothetical protein
VQQVVAQIAHRPAHDPRMEFSEMKGFSPRNLQYMKAFAEAYYDKESVQEPLAQIIWHHNKSKRLPRSGNSSRSLLFQFSSHFLYDCTAWLLLSMSLNK